MECSSIYKRNYFTIGYHMKYSVIHIYICGLYIYILLTNWDAHPSIIPVLFRPCQGPLSSLQRHGPANEPLDGMNHGLLLVISQLWTDARYDAMIETWNMSPSAVGSCQLPVSKAWLKILCSDALHGSNRLSGANVKINGMLKGSAIA